MRNSWRKDSETIKKRKSLILQTLGISISLAAFLQLTLGSDSLRTYLNLKTKVEDYQYQTEQIKKETEILLEKIELIQDTENSYLLEELARELGYVRPGEILYKYKDDN